MPMIQGDRWAIAIARTPFPLMVAQSTGGLPPGAAPRPLAPNAGLPGLRTARHGSL